MSRNPLIFIMGMGSKQAKPQFSLTKDEDQAEADEYE
jgi:hypothetical protein